MVPAPREKASIRGSLLLPILSVLFVLAIYVWLISVGTWTDWPGRSSVYDQLATAFRHGHLALDVPVDKALLALPDPYDPAARQNVPFLRDYSLYNGRYYLYFGPVPALILAVVKSLTAAPIGDQYVTFVSVAGIFIMLSLLIIRIRSVFFPASPPWTAIPALITAGLMAPLPWLLTTSSIYTAAIAAGQFFFLAGFLPALEALRRKPVSPSGLLFAGLLWAAALGSRISLVLSVAVVSLLLVIHLFLQYRRRLAPFSAQLGAGLCFLGPIVAALAALAWYNWARFGSFLEAGFMYQLGGIFKWQHIGEFVWPGYAVQNFYNYFLNPPALKYPFPYFFPQRGMEQSIIAALPIPDIYHSQEITGLIYTAPFLLLAAVPVLSISRKSFRKQRESTGLFTWLVVTLLGSFLMEAAFFLAFFWAAERYLVDFFPAALLLTILGMWQVDGQLEPKPRRRALYWLGLVLIMAACAVLGIFLALTFKNDSFRQLNPVLWRQLGNLFRP